MTPRAAVGRRARKRGAPFGDPGQKDPLGPGPFGPARKKDPLGPQKGGHGEGKVVTPRGTMPRTRESDVPKRDFARTVPKQLNKKMHRRTACPTPIAGEHRLTSNGEMAKVRATCNPAGLARRPVPASTIQRVPRDPLPEPPPRLCGEREASRSPRRKTALLPSEALPSLA